MSWADVGEFLRAIGPVATAGAAWFAAYTAKQGLQKWRDETIGKRRAEVAQQVLADFYRIQDVFKEVRANQVLAHEMQPDEGEDEKLVREPGYAPIRRLGRNRDAFAELRARKYAFAAVFGKEVTGPYDEVVRVHNTIFVASEPVRRNVEVGQWVVIH